MREQHIIDTFRQQHPNIGYIQAQKQLMTYLVTVRFANETFWRYYTGVVTQNGVRFENTIFLPDAPKPDVFVPDEFSIVCAWCGAVKHEGPAGAEVSHTICPTCFEKLEVA